jgi:hypothetical protein
MQNSNNICYIDTDGIKITSKLPSHQVGPELGKMKLEGIIIIIPESSSEINTTPNIDFT